MTTGVDFLRNVPFFANLPTSDLEGLAQRLVTRKYRAGEQIFKQGSPGNSLYIVKTGRVAIVVTDPQGRTQTLAERGYSQFFGEFALLDGLPRSAGVVAREPGELLILSRPEFFIYLEHNPAVAIRLMVLISRRLRFALQLAESDVNPPPPLARMAHVLTLFAERYGESEDGTLRVSIHITRGELAEVLGCPRIEADAALDTLHQQNLVEIRGREIFISDLDQLRRIGSNQPA